MLRGVFYFTHMEIVFFLLILIVAFLYSSVGHGGASGYLALMALFSIDPSLMKSSALMLNVFVSSVAFISFYKGGHFKWKLLLPFVITSIPMAYLGAGLKIVPSMYNGILAVCLLLGIVRMLFMNRGENENSKPLPFWVGLAIGAVLGFMSGLIGIGGGIILSPILIIFRWASMKETAAVSAMFILLNSVSGLVGLGLTGFVMNNEMVIALFMAIAGGMAGSYAGSFKWQYVKLKYALALVLFVASVKLLII